MGDASGATPMSPDDYEGLLPGWIATRGDLDQAEASSISTARSNYLSQKFALGVILESPFVRNLHRAMFRNVWTWAGLYRTREMSIGVDPRHIQFDVENLMQDAQVWLADALPDGLDNDLCSLHHRLTAIHPFTNGNGRFSRLYVEVLASNLDIEPYTWGFGEAGKDPSTIRREYLASLREADNGDLSRLRDFVRS